MSERNRAPAAAGARASVGAGIAGDNTTPAFGARSYYTRIDDPCQLDALADLADQARGQAHRAGLAAEACREVGDLRGWELWRRRQLAHQRVQFEAERAAGGEL